MAGQPLPCPFGRKIMNGWMIGGIAVLAAAVAAYANYRRFVHKPTALIEAPYQVETRSLTVNAGNHALSGQLLIPRGMPGKLPTVIVSHGLNSNAKNAIALVGMSLAMSGFQVYCFDFYGGSIHSARGGRMEDMTVFSEKEDLHTVIERIKQLETTDLENLFLLGESQGGFVTAITAVDHPEVKGLIEYYPAFCIPEDARKRHGSPERIPEYERFGQSKLGKSYSASVWDYNVYDVIPSYCGPVLIIHGDHDRIVDISYGRRASEVYKQSEFICLPGEIHGFTGAGARKAAALSYDFMKKVMKK